MNPVRVEVCVDSVAGALVATQASGVSRIELCAELGLGGITPGRGLLRRVRAAVEGELTVLIRPRAGDFCFQREEFLAALDDVTLARDEGADGIAVGMLDAEGALDPRCEDLIAAAQGMRVTVHRAFDRCVDPLAALERIVAWGCARVLSSGQAPSVQAGMAELERFAAAAAGRVDVVPAGGVDEDSIPRLLAIPGIADLHFSASVPLIAPVSSTGLDLGSEERRVVDPGRLERLLSAVRTSGS